MIGAAIDAETAGITGRRLQHREIVPSRIRAAIDPAEIEYLLGIRTVEQDQNITASLADLDVVASDRRVGDRLAGLTLASWVLPDVLAHRCRRPP